MVSHALTRGLLIVLVVFYKPETSPNFNPFMSRKTPMELVQKNEIRAWLDLYKLMMQAAIGLLLAIILQGLLGELFMIELSIIVSLYLIAFLLWVSNKYIRLAKEIDYWENKI